MGLGQSPTRLVITIWPERSLSIPESIWQSNPARLLRKRSHSAAGLPASLVDAYLRRGLRRWPQGTPRLCQGVSAVRHRRPGTSMGPSLSVWCRSWPRRWPPCAKSTWTRKPLLGRLTLTRVGAVEEKEKTAADLDSDRLGFSERIRLRLPLAPKGFRKLWRTYHGCGNFSRVRHHQATRRRFDGAEAQRLQRLFETNHKLCVREILEATADATSRLSTAELTAFFRGEYAEQDIDAPAWLKIVWGAPTLLRSGTQRPSLERRSGLNCSGCLLHPLRATTTSLRWSTQIVLPSLRRLSARASSAVCLMEKEHHDWYFCAKRETRRLRGIGSPCISLQNALCKVTVYAAV